MKIDIVVPVLRQILIALGTWLASVGYIDDGMIDVIVGLGVNVATLAWWAYDRHRINKANKLAKAAAEAVAETVGKRVTDLPASKDDIKEIVRQRAGRRR